MSAATGGTVLDGLLARLTAAAAYSGNDAVAPVCVLWPDRDGAWASVVGLVRGRAPFPLLTVGPYDAETATGPAIWVRCVLAGTVAAPDPDRTGVPVVYLPGVSRADLKPDEDVPKLVQPLAELQYRGTVWSHKNGRDWSPLAFVQSAEGGLGLQVDANSRTRESLGPALQILAGLPVAELAEQIIDADYLDDLVTPDPPMTLLRWIDDPATARLSMPTEIWPVFVGMCHKDYGVDLEKDSLITAAGRLGKREGRWADVWRRYVDNPRRFPSVQDRLANAQPTRTKTMFDSADGDEPAGEERLDPRAAWPGANAAMEAALADGLRALATMTTVEAREAILVLDRRHGRRREWVWATLGTSPLAGALWRLAELVRATATPLPGATVVELAAAYAAGGAEADGVVLAALALLRETPGALEPIKIAIGAVYKPWLDELAHRFQTAAVGPSGYVPSPPVESESGACLLFCDGLRYDVGAALMLLLTAHDLRADLGWRLAALPTVTSTAKPAVAPRAIVDALTGGPELGPAVVSTGSTLTPVSFAKLLGDAGVQHLTGGDTGDPVGAAWTETGQIDGYGHKNGWKVAYHVRDELGDILHRVQALLGAGWQKIVVVTDHGWLLNPAGLNKAELPISVTEPRKGRCARLTPGAATDHPTAPWRWDPTVRIAFAPGARSFQAGVVYDHGGLSPQECVVPVITVTAKAAGDGAVTIVDVRWSGLRCIVRLSGARPDLVVDLRLRAGDPASSVAHQAKGLDPDGTVAVFVDGDRDDLLGEQIQVVVTDKDNTVVAERPTTAGG